MAIKVLIHEWVTGGGLAGSPLPDGWAAEGRTMRRALADDFQKVAGVEVVMTLDARFRTTSPPYRVVSVARNEETATLARLSADADFTLVIAPETGGVLAARARLIESAGGRSLGASASAVSLSGNKLRLAAHFLAHGVRTIPTALWRIADVFPSSMAFPAVLKPIDGAGAVRTFLLNGPEDLARIRAESSPSALSAAMVLQPFCRGEPLSATFLIGPSGTTRLIGVGWQSIVIRQGMLTYQGGRLPAPAEFASEAPAEAIRCVPGLRGVVGVDFLRDPASGVTTVVEINPRPTTSYVGLSRLLPGGAIARAWLAAFRGDGTSAAHAMIPARPDAGLRFRPDGTVVQWEASADGRNG